MLYQDYKERINKRVKIRRVLRRYRVPIISVISLIVMLIAAFMVTKGMVFGDSLETDKIEYGNKPSFTASAVFSDVRYEFTKASEDKWTTAVPVLMGDYRMRVVANGVFGERLSDEQSFSIVQRKISVVSNTSTVVYGEKPGVTASLAFDDRVVCSEFVFDDDTKMQTNVTPVKASVKVIDRDGKDVTDCYAVGVAPSMITFTKRPITLTVGSVETTYNDEYFSHEAWEVTGGSLAYDDDVVKVVDNSFTSEKDAGQVENKGEFRVLRGSKDITNHYDITQISGTISIAQRPVTVYTNDVTQTYTGQEWYDISFRIDETTPLLEGHSMTVSGWNKLSTVGEVENLLSFVISKGKDEEKEDVTDNYCFVYKTGKITVLPREITIETQTEVIEYDGKEHSFEVPQIISEAKPALGHSLKLKEESKTVVKNVTEGTENKLEFDVVDGNGNSVADNYAITYQNGTITVNKKPITVKSDDLGEDAYYNGRAQGAEGVDYDANELCQGHTLEPTFGTYVTDCLDEAIDNEFKVTIRDENGVGVTENYEVNKIYGKLKLNPLPISIITGSAYKIYDGTPLYEHSFTYEEGSAEIVSGQRVEYVNATEQTNADLVDNVFEIEIYSGDEKKTFNYDISYTYGELDVARRPFVVTSLPFEEKVYYDGQKHRNEKYEISAAEGLDFALVENHEETVEFLLNSYVEFASDGSEKDNLFNVVEIRDTVANEDVTGNYAPIQVYGVLKLEKRPVIFVSGSIDEGTVIYDGEEHTKEECFAKEVDQSNLLSNMGLVEGHTPEGVYFSGIIDAGEIDNEFMVVAIFDKNNSSVIDNYIINGCEYGRLRVAPRPIILISKSDEKMYDGTPLENTDYEVGGMGLVKNERLDYSNNATITDVLIDENGNVSSIENSYEFGVRGGRGRKENYTVEKTQFGTLTVTKRPITLTSCDASKVYDNQPLYNSELLISGIGLAKGQRVACIDYAMLTDVHYNENGEVDSILNTFGCEFRWKDNGKLVSYDNYDVTKYEIGELKVTKRPATITIKGGTKEYDGTPLGPAGYTYTRQSGATGILDIHKVDMVLGGAITKVGSVSVQYSDPVVSEPVNGTDVIKTPNYEITIKNATLTVTKRHVILNAKKETQEYTGEVIYPTFGNEDVIYASNPYVMGLGKGDSISVIFTQGERTELGTSVVKIKTPDGWTMTNKDGEDVTFCYEVEEVKDGELTVIPRKISIILHGNSKQYYDGAPIVNDGYTVDNFLYNIGHTIDFDTVGEQTDFGYSYASVVESSIVIKDKNGNDASKYYELVKISDGLLEVKNKRPLTVTSANDFFVYDGLPHKNEDGHVIIDNCPAPMQREEEAVVTYNNEEMVAPGEYENRLTVQMFIKDTSTETTKNYDIEYEYGKIIIGGVDIEIKTGGGEKVYDGVPLENPEVTYNCPNGKPDGLEIFVVATGSQTDVGSSQNTYGILAFIDGRPFPDEGFNIIDEDLGELKVTPLELVISTESGETTYSDDSPVFVYNVYTSNFTDTEDLKLSVETAMLTDIGERNNDVLSVDMIGRNGLPVSRDNFTYRIESVGTIIMYADTISVESKSDHFYYDGTAHSCPEHFPPAGHINPTHTLVTSGYNYYTDVGEYENFFDTVDVVDRDGKSVKKYYPDIVCKYNKIVIDKREIKIEAPTIVERYENGKVIYAPNEIVIPNEYLDELNNNISGNEYGYEIDCNMAEIAYATEIGVDVEYYIPLEHFYITLNGERLSQDGFDIIENKPGYLRFSDKLVIINVYEVSGTYDGDRLEYFEDDWFIEDGQLPKDYWLELDLSGIGLSEVGVIDFDEMLDDVLQREKLAVYRLDEVGNPEEVTYLFEFKFAGTPLTLNKAQLVLTAGSATKVYDGSPLTNNSYTITGGSLKEGHVIKECKISGSITETGYALNEIVEVVIVDMNDKDGHGTPKDVTDYYKIDTVDGYLIVTEDKDK